MKGLVKKMVFGLAFVAVAVLAEPTVTDFKTTQWNGFAKDEFKLDGSACLVVKPTTTAKGAPWVWRPEFFGHEPQSELAVLSNGFHAVYISMNNSFGCPSALDKMDLFYAYLRKTYQLNEKTVLSGFSRGGLYAFNWAARNPKQVAAIYVDNPVCDFKSWPGGKGKGKGSAGDWKKLLADYGFADEQAALAYKLNPVDNLATIAAAKIPVLGICGDSDTVVPFAENFGLVKARYEALGGPLQVIIKPGCNHHPHSLKDPTPITQFMLKAYGL